MVHGGVDLLTARALSLLLADLALTERKAPPTAAA